MNRLLLVVLPWFLACTSSVVSEREPADVCQLGAQLTLPDEGSLPVTKRYRSDSCVLEGVDAEGVLWRVECFSFGCKLVADEVDQCVCKELDHGNPCDIYAGCADWPIFDHGDFREVWEK